MKKNYDTIVIGGGIIGMSIARELARRGQSVAIFDKGALGQEASKAAAGVLMPMMHENEPLANAFFSLCVDSLRRYKKFVEDIEEENDTKIFFGTQGVLYLAFDKNGIESLKKLQKDIPLDSKWRTHDELLKTEPELSSSVEAGVCVGQYRHVHNQDLVALLAMDLQMQGTAVEIHEFSHARKVEYTSAGVSVSTDDGTFSAENVVLAAGSWSSQIEGISHLLPPIKPMRGQILKALAPARTFLRHPIYWDRFYIVPRGREIIIGSTMEDAGFEKRVTISASADLLRKAAYVVPALGNCGIMDSWAGLRPMAPDGFPVIGKIAEHVIAATGHFRDGILLAPSTAAFVTELICEGKTNSLIKPFGIERFAKQPAKKVK